MLFRMRQQQFHRNRESLREIQVDKCKETLTLPLMAAEFRYTMGGWRVPAEKLLGGKKEL